VTHKYSFIVILVSLAISFTLTCAVTDEVGQECDPGIFQCSGSIALKCAADGYGWQVDQDCADKDLTCTTKGCLVCEPETMVCQAEKLLRCNEKGTGYLSEPVLVCDASKGELCDGETCTNACDLAKQNRSYVGCEYWAVDLDNAVVQIGAAAAQQFAVVLSNPSPLPATVTITIDEAKVGEPAQIKVFDTRTIAPQALEVVLLDPREVDGSPPGEYNTGTGTAVTRNAYKITSTAPLIAYQFNPLSNVSVFSNDASLLIPTEAFTTGSDRGADYLVMGWPQTIASTDDRFTNFGVDLRAFMTIVATRDETIVSVDLKTGIIGDGPDGKIPATEAGKTLTVELDAYEVLNLETGGFGSDADFTGSIVSTNKPVAVFSGSEASDVPDTPDLTYRRCCADHLEEQIFPRATLGRTFIALKTPSRTKALKEAGATINEAIEKEYFRILASGEFTTVATNLPDPFDKFTIDNLDFMTLEVERDFTIESNSPVVVGQFVAGQQSAGIPNTLPGGDPSFILLPSIEQFRKDYLFLTPDKYAFDFILIAAPEKAELKLDGRPVKEGCDDTTGLKLCCSKNNVGSAKIPGDDAKTNFVAYKCQLSFPQIIAGRVPPNNLQAGSQNDGVHRLISTHPVGVIVYGFDAYVSYGYPGGTDLELINVQ
jgi:hypothetical protein